ncbi:hypothetical protein CORT_0H00370 [Candida orthopsilosis Co 90-125]|uniref:BTB domain-containing protein n=1 Tax=Candida orthopsilosis (strain 90-125) TaxID=1136231 RepID=H8XBG7_CANO9|nr:hypothetical protein CORT_0H00370 [Candida orthopsilosis Co 90-125]CCG25155.1 hypothetical protein CORT_0H00370 [Candida orthopsilosis Co 90-125]
MPSDQTTISSTESLFSGLNVNSQDSRQESLHSSESSPSESSNVQDAFAKICMACRTGDYEVVDSLLSTPNLDINQVDEYDYSPLILSSLCGHLKIVELLLKRGAVCDRDTFQGARCIYGALTDEIRDLLVSFDISKAVDVNQPFAGHIASLYTTSANKDVVFNFRPKGLSSELSAFSLHRFLLVARSSYFREKFQNDWSFLSVVEMPNEVDPLAFRVIVDYIYLRTDSMVITEKAFRETVVSLAEEYELEDLASAIKEISSAKDEKEQFKIKHELAMKIVEKARKELDSFLANDIIGNSVSSKMELEKDIELEDINCQQYVTQEQKKTLLESSSIPDSILSYVDSNSEAVIFYPVNKSILTRSEYFDTMFKSNIFRFAEEEIPMYRDGEVSVVNRPQVDESHLPIIQLSTSTADKKVAAMVLSYLYHDDVNEIPLENVVELLYAADELFLERLKTMSAVRLSSQYPKFTYQEFQSLEQEVKYDAYDLIRAAWSTRCDKLEQHVTKMIACNLQDIVEREEESAKLLALIAESAARIRERQDTDTIELVDDIRYYLSKKYAVSEDGESLDPLSSFGYRDKKTENIKLYQNSLLKYERDVEVIENMLDKLNLDA